MPDITAPAPARSADVRVLTVLVLVTASYVWWRLGRGWIPIDDGPVAQSAERVLQGQLPHRDFVELYTGGLAYVNAAAFRLLGTNLWTLRLVLFAVFVAWVPTLYYIARRFVAPLAAASVVCLAVVWSLPNYPAAMASWYSLFLATFGIACVLRYLEAGAARWLAMAGIVGGVSFLVKVIGLYYIAGVLLFLVFHAHAVSRSTANENPGPSRAYAIFVSWSLLLFVVALLWVVRSQFRVMEFLQFVLPGASLAMLLARNEWTEPAGASRERFGTLTRMLVPFLAGAALPIALFLVHYARAGALDAFVKGVFVAPQRRLEFIVVHALPLSTLLALLPFALLIALAFRARGRVTRRETILLVLALLLMLRATGGNGMLYRTVWYAARSLIPVLVLAAIVLLSRRRVAGSLPALLHEQTMLVVAVTAMCSLVQFPYTISMYFCYIAPLVALMALALYRHVELPVGTVPALVVAFVTAFAVLRTNSTRIASIGNWYQPQAALAPLAMERGGIDVPKSDAQLYGSLVTALRSRARGGYTWASPDSPEIYFLTGLRNPTRTLFEVFDDFPSPPEQTLRMLDAHHITAIVLSAPSFSPPISPVLYPQLMTLYPKAEYIGPFQLRWRD